MGLIRWYLDSAKDVLFYTCAISCEATGPAGLSLEVDIDLDTPFKWFYDVFDPHEYWYNLNTERHHLSNDRFAYLSIRAALENEVEGR